MCTNEISMMRKYPKAQRILRDMEDDKELMMWAKEGIATQLRDRPKSSEVAEYVPYGDGTLRLEYRYAGKAPDIVPTGFSSIMLAENRGQCTSTRSRSKRRRRRSMMLSVSELARLSGISGTIAYRLVQERQLPSCRIGRCVRFTKEDVGCYLESCRS